MPLDRFIDDVFLTHRHTAYPVLGLRGEVVGLLTVRDVLELPRAEWAAMTVHDRMLPVERSLVLDAEEDTLAQAAALAFQLRLPLVCTLAEVPPVLAAGPVPVAAVRGAEAALHTLLVGRTGGLAPGSAAAAAEP